MESGSDHIIMRLSETNNLDETTSPGLLPSVAFKFLRDNDMSYNVFAMPSFSPTDSWNFFEKPFLNVVKPFDKKKHEIERKTVLKKMTEGTHRPFGTAISDIARCNLDGSTVDEVKVPYRLSFQSPIDFSPDKEYEELEDGIKRWVWWYEQLQRIPEDSTIFEVFGWTAPEKLDGELVKIADIKLRSALHTSEFGDNRLFFRHQGIAKDRKFWPKAWRRTGDDPWFSRKVEKNIWGFEVPEGVWPDDEDEAKALYDE